MRDLYLITKRVGCIFLLLLIVASFVVSPASARQIIANTEPPKDPTDFLLYLPVASKPFDNYITDIEVTQATQNLNTPVELVAGRTTMVRAYARTIYSVPISGLSATIKGYRSGTLIGELGPISGSAYPATYSINTLRADKNKSFNFQLPASWVNGAGDLALEIELQDSSLASDQAPAGALFSRTVTFKYVPALNVVAVPIKLITSGYTYLPPDTSYLYDALMRMYPVPEVNIDVHSSYTFVGDLRYESKWVELLNEISALHDSEVGWNSDTVYYGVIPLLDGHYSWFPGSGITGIGWVGSRISVGLSDQLDDILTYLSAPDTAAHEIGHNLGRLHTYGCGASSIDYSYPYSNGLIGQYGLRFSDQFVVPNTYNDIMNYCDNQWISDFTYKGLLDDQLATLSRLSAPAQESLYLRAIISDDGSVDLEPTYIFSTSPDLTEHTGGYSLQFVGSSGETISEHSLGIVTAQEHGLTINAIRTAVPLPDQPFSAIRLLHLGQEVTQKNVADHQLAAKTAALNAYRSDNELILNWEGVQQPTLVRYSSDDGATWTTVGVDLMENKIPIELENLPPGRLVFQVLPADSQAVFSLEYLKSIKIINKTPRVETLGVFLFLAHSLHHNRRNEATAA